MSRSPAELLRLLDLDVLEVDLYRGESMATPWQRVFGGQVLGQALVAAGRSVDVDRRVHSLHGYFLRPGDPAGPIIYHVERARDGRTFTTRRVVATQHGKRIFTMSASFQISEPGLEHQDPLPAAPPPESVRTMQQRHADGKRSAEWWQEFGAYDVRRVDSAPGSHSQVWLRINERLPDDPLIHESALAYVSDLTLLAAALAPHDLLEGNHSVLMASLDHAMWFHRPFRVDEWLLYDQHSPSASGARGFGTGRIFTASGALVASVAQEGLIRPLVGE